MASCSGRHDITCLTPRIHPPRFFWRPWILDTKLASERRHENTVRTRREHRENPLRPRVINLFYSLFDPSHISSMNAYHRENQVMISITSHPCLKRRRLNEDSDASMSGESDVSLTAMLKLGQWDEAVQFVRSTPAKVGTSSNPSPLAVACRSGAPYECVKALLEAAPGHLRRVLDSRGTPLHEAIVSENTGTNVIKMLLQADEDLGSETTRATLLQDVDGFTPLHLLIRRRFQTHMERSEEDEDSSFLQILEMLVRSSPEAVTIPDRGEYEEPPIIYAIKANMYAPGLGSEDSTLARIERQIYQMVELMLRYNPSAATAVLSGYRGQVRHLDRYSDYSKCRRELSLILFYFILFSQYTGLHSAVFHGRCTDTIELILRAEAGAMASPNQQKAALLQNTQGEIPLHFCAMRGEWPRSVALIADAAPAAVLKRDTSGLTPFHWLWARFVSTVLTIEDGLRRGNHTTITISANRPTPMDATRYNDFAILEQGDFDVDLQLIKRVDPPLDFLRMRHIPVEVVADDDSLDRANRSAGILKRIRERHYEHLSRGQEDEADDAVEWTREEAVSALFWTKVVSLLQAANRAAPTPLIGDSILVHTAFASKCCLPAVAQMVAQMYPEELMTRDSRGQLPLHCAASRPWDRWDWPSDDSLNEPIASQLLHRESLGVLRVALTLSPPEAVRIADFENRLVLHHLIDTVVVASTRMTKSMREDCLEEMLRVIQDIIRMYPESLQRRDGFSKLYPFQQATATATSQGSFEYEQFPLSITYDMLRENPTLLETARRS
jgi:hypothetical protein